MVQSHIIFVTKRPTVNLTVLIFGVCHFVGVVDQLKLGDESQLTDFEHSSTWRDNDLACHLWKTRCHARK